MGRRLTPIARWSIHSTGLAGSSRAPTSRISLSSRLMTIPSCIRRRCSRAPFLLRGVSPRGRRTAEQRDEQQPLEWSGERYVPSHRIFAADTGTIEDEHALRFNPQAWEKYLKAQRPSQNIEDRRKFEPTKVLMDTSLQ